MMHAFNMKIDSVITQVGVLNQRIGDSPSSNVRAKRDAIEGAVRDESSKHQKHCNGDMALSETQQQQHCLGVLQRDGGSSAMAVAAAAVQNS
jgi:hypothetical protein